MKIKYDVLEKEYARAGEASSNFKRTLKQLAISADIVRKVAIAMYEAEINMVIHANGGVIEAEVLPEKILVKLADSGPGIPDIEKAKQEGFSTASETARDLGFGAGMGIPNMMKNSDFFNIETELGKGTTVTIAVNL